MNPAFPPKTPRMLLPTTALLALLIGVAVTLTQCKMVTDTLATTGVAGTESTVNCIADCEHTANDAKRAENNLHEANVRACAGNRACLAAEDARHEAALIRIQLSRKNCQDRCHHQGGGNGGK